MRAFFIPAFAAVMLLTACDQKQSIEPPKPQEITSDATGHFCGMSLREHPGPKGQIFVEGQKNPVWFASVRETFAFTMLPEEPKNIAAIYVTDMGKTKNWQRPDSETWIDATRAYYVIDSDKRGGMGAEEAVPFGEKGQAQRFSTEHGGHVVRFAEMPQDYILQYDGEDVASAAAHSGGRKESEP